MKKLFLVLLLAGLLLFGCITDSQSQNETQNTSGQVVNMSEKTVKKGDIIHIDYVGSFENGSVFDTSLKDEAIKANLNLRDSYGPLTFTVGDGSVIKGFDNGVIGMKEEQEKIVVIKPGDAYGPYNENAVITVNRSQLQVEGGEIFVGSQLQASNGAMGIVTQLSNDSVTINFNHPLAGRTLIFRLILRKISN